MQADVVSAQSPEELQDIRCSAVYKEIHPKTPNKPVNIFIKLAQPIVDNNMPLQLILELRCRNVNVITR